MNTEEYLTEVEYLFEGLEELKPMLYHYGSLLKTENDIRFEAHFENNDFRRISLWIIVQNDPMLGMMKTYWMQIHKKFPVKEEWKRARCMSFFEVEDCIFECTQGNYHLIQNIFEAGGHEQWWD